MKLCISLFILSFVCFSTEPAMASDHISNYDECREAVATVLGKAGSKRKARKEARKISRKWLAVERQCEEQIACPVSCRGIKIACKHRKKVILKLKCKDYCKKKNLTGNNRATCKKDCKNAKKQVKSVCNLAKKSCKALCEKRKFKKKNKNRCSKARRNFFKAFTSTKVLKTKDIKNSCK